MALPRKNAIYMYPMLLLVKNFSSVWLTIENFLSAWLTMVEQMLHSPFTFPLWLQLSNGQRIALCPLVLVFIPEFF